MTTTPHRGDAAPGYLLYLTDPARAAFDYTLLAYATPLLAALPRGDNHPVLVLPRLHATDASTSTLRTVLKRLGYRTYGWQLGRNIGPTSKVVHGMRARLDYLTNRYQRPVTLIGWSLGGIYARQLARRTPQAVRQVITLSSPIRLVRHEQSRANRLFHLYAHEHIEPLNLPLERDEGPLPVPQRRSTPRSTGSSPGGPAWTSPRLAQRTSPFSPATSASPIILRRFGRSRTASPNPPTNGSRFNRRRYCGRPT